MNYTELVELIDKFQLSNKIFLIMVNERIVKNTPTTHV